MPRSMPRPFARIIGGGERGPAGPRQAPEEQQQQRTGGIRGWLSGGGRGNHGAPEPPTATATLGQEMRSTDSNIVSPISPVVGHQQHALISPSTSPLSRNNSMGYNAMEFYVPQHSVRAPMQPIIERPEPAMQRDTIGMSANTAGQPDGMQAPLMMNLEAQGLVKSRGRRFWRRRSRKGLQSKLATVLVSALFLAVTLAIYLGLALSHDLRHEWHVLLILTILVATMFFCHALIRLCIMATNPRRFQRLSRNFTRIPSVAGPSGYANPREPIRIHTPHGADSTKSPPPVYGLWRCSVRVNPDQFFWVRRANAGLPTTSGGRGQSSRDSRTAPRPPSYASEDGVTYALAPHQLLRDPPRPPHPSEVNRMP
ncbi:unnamed protein product [Tuber aestivum]|uniref:Uncharacterized protein n=1 Tax=Tuber aestivum TaxID=59557 RepID=A0A292PZE3_9PEZI|nr:unnamed protein product [Tuber aestivum]